MEELQTLVRDLAVTVQNLSSTIQGLSSKIDSIDSKLDRSVADIENKLDRSNADFLVYQKANQSLTSLAFSLIASATVITIVTNVFYRR
jgi:predicted PurR-regulated permease PerM